MSETFGTLTVALDSDMREVDVAPIMDAIGRLRGVAGVTAHRADLGGGFAARIRAAAEVREAMLTLLDKLRNA